MCPGLGLGLGAEEDAVALEEGLPPGHVPRVLLELLPVRASHAPRTAPTGGGRSLPTELLRSRPVAVGVHLSVKIQLRCIKRSGEQTLLRALPAATRHGHHSLAPYNHHGGPRPRHLR